MLTSVTLKHEGRANAASVSRRLRSDFRILTHPPSGWTTSGRDGLVFVHPPVGVPPATASRWCSDLVERVNAEWEGFTATLNKFDEGNE